MINNYWEEQSMENHLLSFHEKQMEKMNLPDWIKEIHCPFCHKELILRSIRNVQLCLNTRNFGEVAIEVFCDDCKKMDTVYFRTKMDSIADFADSLQGSYSMPSNYVLEEKMYKMNYNNILEQMVKNKGEDNHDSL
jgi:hypothetical protein